MVGADLFDQYNEPEPQCLIFQLNRDPSISHLLTSGKE